MVVWLPRMCRRFLKFAYDVVRVCMGEIYSLLVRGVSRSMSGHHVDTPITIKAKASSKADSHPN